MTDAKKNMDAFIKLLAKSTPKSDRLLWSHYYVASKHFAFHRYEKTGDKRWLALAEQFEKFWDELPAIEME